MYKFSYIASDLDVMAVIILHYMEYIMQLLMINVYIYKHKINESDL